MAINPKVLLVAEHASARFGGEAVLPLHYYRVLKSRGVPVWLVVHDRTRQELNELFPGDEHVIFVQDSWWQLLLYRIEKHLPSSLRNLLNLDFARRIGNQLKQKKIIKRIILEEGITVVHQPILVSPKEPSLFFGFGIPVIIGPMNGGMNYPPGFRFMQSRFERLSIWLGRCVSNLLNLLIPGKRYAAKLLVANQRTLEALPSVVKNEKVSILVENGVDLDLWKATCQRPIKAVDEPTEFIYLGRLVDLKAIDLLLEAFAQACNEAPMTLSIIGDGVARFPLEKLAEKLGLLANKATADKVKFWGWLSQEECVHHLKNADSLVLPSLRECGGAVVLEAMAMSLPVIATQWGGPADYLDSTCGILVKPSDKDSFVRDLAEALKTLAKAPDKRVEMGKAGRGKVERYFDWEHKVNQMMEFYTALETNHCRPAKKFFGAGN